MKNDAIILVVEADDPSYELIEINLQRSGICNGILRFKDAKGLLEFLFDPQAADLAQGKRSYLLILDCLESMDVLERIKQDDDLGKIPVVMLTDSDERVDVSRCHELGCSTYLVKPKDQAEFASAVQKIGLFLSVVEVPEVGSVG
ncbi:MAG: response regulator [Deltaproteobacteria bacterium]|nr:response regulator [Deltaproteobacteria bacterium]